jgi:hypothetical protein
MKEVMGYLFPVPKIAEPNLTIFFKCFLNTPAGMDADLGFGGRQ